MSWVEREIEKYLQNRLQDELSEKGKELYAHYVNTRTRVVESILPEIKRIENDLTDHGIVHIGDVLDKIGLLLKIPTDSVTAIELYYLCLLGLFHDVGNIHGRKGHYEKAVILEIYDFAVGDNSKYKAEKMLVAEGASAHSGKASDGTTNTMKELYEGNRGLHGKSINLRRLAPVLRFADELCEGPQRTSDYMLLHHKYEKKSELHHKYAQITDIFIDKYRIALTYNIDVVINDHGLNHDEKENLKKLLEYVYKRIIKLNSERQYTKYYSDLLSQFNATTVQINFLLNGTMPCDIGLNELRITDLIVPDKEKVKLINLDSSYDIDSIIHEIESVNKTIKVS